MKKDDKLIMVVEREQLFGKNGEMWFEGFKPHYETDYISIILQKHKYFPRSTAETDPSYKQPIAYLLVVNPVQRSVFVYKRASKDSAYSEKRLQGKWSWGIGG
ncbi:MAG: DNA mismatch repair protein MutT, partial [Candidatus Woesearchaeota archaeon]